MGLDMYLNRRIHVANYGISNERSWEVSIKRGGQDVSVISSKEVTTIEQEVLYWRKANEIHAWFVDRLANGVDNCVPIEVDISELIELRNITAKVLEASELIEAEVVNGYSISTGEDGEMVKIPNMEMGKKIADPTVASQLLPTQSGFFFGSTDYDQYYYEDVKMTHDKLTEVIGEHQALVERGVYPTYTYEASW